MANTTYPTWIEQQLDRMGAVAKRSEHRDAQKPRHATAAPYDSAKKRIVVQLDNGADFSFPPTLAQGLASASAKELAAIVLSPLGTGLHWPLLDVDLTVDGLLVGVFGSKNWMRAHAAKAGSARTPSKAAAARANGTKGGRPRKVAQSFA